MIPLELLIFIKGILLAGSLIVAIGSQNAFVLQQGILQKRVFLVCLTCFVSDTILITLGGLGLSVLIVGNMFFLFLLSYGGSIYLFVYGSIKLISVFRKNQILVINENDKSNKKSNGNAKSIFLNTLAVTWLNPHVYFDTVILIGSVASQYEKSQKIAFLLGCVVFSFIWFFSLGYGGKKLTYLFRRPLTWRLFNFTIALIMYYIAYTLLQGIPVK